MPKINFVNDKAGKPVGIYEHIGYAYIPVEEKEDPTLSFSWSVDGKPVAGGAKSYHFHPHKAGTHTVTCRVVNANRKIRFGVVAELVINDVKERRQVQRRRKNRCIKKRKKKP